MFIIRAKKKHSMNLNELTDSCCICYEVLDPSKAVIFVSFTCRHIYHDECLQQWLEKSGTCPLCRCNVKKERQVGISNVSPPELHDEIMSLVGRHRHIFVRPPLRHEILHVFARIDERRVINESLRSIVSNSQVIEQNFIEQALPHDEPLLPSQPDVRQVMEEAKCTEAQAICALSRKHGNIEEAIFEIIGNEDDVRIVINQTRCTRQQAIHQLILDRNMVDAILNLTP